MLLGAVEVERGVVIEISMDGGPGKTTTTWQARYHGSTADLTYTNTPLVFLGQASVFNFSCHLHLGSYIPVMFEICTPPRGYLKD
jgi:hypothetical protein